jgi:ribosomal protein S18 acetylase RimI-like enzyme
MTSCSLDDPVGESLRGRHAHLAVELRRVARYTDGVATFVAVPSEPSPDDWADVAALLGPGGFVDLFSAEVEPPAGWEPVFTMRGVQMVLDSEADVASDERVVLLEPSDVPAMLRLAEVTRPGPFWSRTSEMGRFYGIRNGDRLVAMVGERLKPPGWTEISTVCTDPSVRGRGLAGALVAHACAAIRARGDRPFLHVASGNMKAHSLYERLGFIVRRDVTFRGFTVPSWMHIS